MWITVGQIIPKFENMPEGVLDNCINLENVERIINDKEEGCTIKFVSGDAIRVTEKYKDMIEWVRNDK